jgi:hypothetical protein
MAKFVDQDDSRGPFNGCLIVLNIHQETKLPKQYEDNLIERISQAQANGYAIFYLFDASNGVGEIKDTLPQDEHFDFRSLLSSIINIQTDINLSIDPKLRYRQLRGIADKVLYYPNVQFANKDAAIMGSCQIDGDLVLVPYTEL